MSTFIMIINYRNLTKNQSIDTGMAFVLICLLLANFFFKITFLNYIAILILLITMSIPIILKPFAFLWFNFSHYLGTIVSTILLSTIFFVLVTPVGILVRFFKKDPLTLKAYKQKTDSILKMRHYLFTEKDLKHPY